MKDFTYIWIKLKSLYLENKLKNGKSQLTCMRRATFSSGEWIGGGGGRESYPVLGLVVFDHYKKNSLAFS